MTSGCVERGEVPHNQFNDLPQLLLWVYFLYEAPPLLREPFSPEYTGTTTPTVNLFL